MGMLKVAEWNLTAVVGYPVQWTLWSCVAVRHGHSCLDEVDYLSLPNNDDSGYVKGMAWLAENNIEN